MYEYMIVAKPFVGGVVIEPVVRERYPSARFEYRPGEIRIYITVMGWHNTDDGEEGFFERMYRDDLISKWVRYSRRPGEQEWNRQ